MSINIRFQKANKFFIENNYLKGLEILKNVWIQYPKNTRLIDEINRHSKKFKKSIIPTFSDKEIEFFFNMHRDGKINSVIEKLVQIYKKKPDDILLISLLGTFYGLNKDYDRAIFFQKIAIEKAPFEPAFHRNLSETFKKVDKIKDALSFLYFAKILSLNDKSIDYEIAKLNTDLKNYLAADLIYKRLMTEENINNEIKYSYCSNLIKLNKVNEAILFLEKIQINDDKNDILTSLLGVAYFQLKNFELAKKNFLKAINLNKNNDNAYTNLGNCYFELGLIKQAEDSHNNSLKINPNNKMALNNLAALYFFKGDINNAEKFYTLSINSNQKNYEAKYSLAQCQLAKLNYKEGWSNFDFRWLSHYFNSPIFQTNWPKFKIKSERKNVLLWQEQGIGDQILFIRFLKDLIPIINNLYIEIDKRLHPIIKRLYPNINFYNKALSIDETNINSQLPLGDLGSFFVQDDSYFLKNNKSYITSDIKKNEELQSKLNSKNKIKCGISWISKNKDIGLNKSLTLEMLKPILSISNISFIDLQYNDTNVERENFYKNNGIKIDKIKELDNFNDINGITSLIDICDFVITVSNSNAHLSGALGKETFLLLPKGKGKLWYWTSQNYKSVWYPSIQIVEQEEPGCWDKAIIKLSKIIKEKSSE